MPRLATHDYVDPLDAIWIGAAERMGLRIERTRESFATSTGWGTLEIGTRDLLDPDDCLAQMILHEVCHWVVQGRKSIELRDWGLDNESDRHLVEEEACLRLQAFLTTPHGLRWVLAPTTDHRSFYDALPDDPLERGATDAGVRMGRAAAVRVRRSPWAPHLDRALEATARAVGDAAALGATTSEAGRPALHTRKEPALGRHPTGLFLPIVPATAGSCGDCGWLHRSGRGGAARCRELDDQRVDPGWPGCERWEPELECTTCGACCREAYDVVLVAPRDPARTRHPEVVVRDGDAFVIHRRNGRCVALHEEQHRYTCNIYETRPKICREFPRAGAHCLVARRFMGFSL